MKKFLMIAASALFVSTSTFAGGILTNTNQHASFLRMLSRGATTEIDGAISNPAGLAFLPKNGFYAALSIQSAYQTRNIDANCPAIGLDKYYKGTAAAPILPSVFAAYKSDKWTLSGYIAVTGGGGKASFDDGLPMFDASVMGGMTSLGLKKEYYDISSYMYGRQFIYSTQMGLTYKINDNLSAFAGGRMNYFTGGYEGTLKTTTATNLPDMPVGTELVGIDLDIDQTGWGFTPVIGLDYKINKFNFGAKYEFKTNLNIENNTHKNSYRVIGNPENELKDYKHGVNTPSDIPSLLSVAVGYEALPTLRGSVEYHFYDDKNARMASDKQKALTKGTNEYLAGIEWDAVDRLTLSLGGQITDYGLSDNFQGDTSFYCDSYSIGFGAKIKLSSKLDLNAGYMWTTYKDYKKESSNYNNLGAGIKGTNIYSRTNKVFGVSINYSL